MFANEKSLRFPEVVLKLKVFSIQLGFSTEECSHESVQPFLRLIVTPVHVLRFEPNGSMARANRNTVGSGGETNFGLGHVCWNWSVNELGYFPSGYFAEVPILQGHTSLGMVVFEAEILAPTGYQRCGDEDQCNEQPQANLHRMPQRRGRR